MWAVLTSIFGRFGRMWAVLTSVLWENVEVYHPVEGKCHLLVSQRIFLGERHSMQKGVES